MENLLLLKTFLLSLISNFYKPNKAQPSRLKVEGKFFKKIQMKKTETLMIRLTPEEKSVIKAKAKKEKLATATYCRQKLLKDA